VNRLLSAGALVCLVLGAALGTWGWGQRDEARSRIVRQAEENDSRYSSSPFDASYDTFDTACSNLRAAGFLLEPFESEPGSGVSLPPLVTDRTSGSGAQPTAGPAPDPATASSARAIISVLDRTTVLGFPELDRPEVVSAMRRQRVAMQRALAAERDPFADPEVQSAAADLTTALDTLGFC